MRGFTAGNSCMLWVESADSPPWSMDRLSPIERAIASRWVAGLPGVLPTSCSTVIHLLQEAGSLPQATADALGAPFRLRLSPEAPGFRL
jgi:hypothetical protein